MLESPVSPNNSEFPLSLMFSDAIEYDKSYINTKCFSSPGLERNGNYQVCFLENVLENLVD